MMSICGELLGSTKIEIPTKLSQFENDRKFITDTELESKHYLTTHQDISDKQNILISGRNIKTLNGQSLLGSGDLGVDILEGKIGDTLPIGTEVEYNGNTVPTGWEQIEEENMDYDFSSVFGNENTRDNYVLLAKYVISGFETDITDKLQILYGYSYGDETSITMKIRRHNADEYTITSCYNEDNISEYNFSLFQIVENTNTALTVSLYARMNTGWGMIRGKSILLCKYSEATSVEYYKKSNFITTKPSGKVVNLLGANTYSTDKEITIGRWINGKPIYRKVITVTSGFSTVFQVSHGISNLDTVVNYYGYFDAYNGKRLFPSIYCANMENYGAGLYSYTSNILEVTIGSTLIATGNISEMQIILEYTKTTD